MGGMVYFDDVRPVVHGVLTKPLLARRTVLLVKIGVNLVRYFNQQRQVFAGDQEFFWILLIAS